MGSSTPIVEFAPPPASLSKVQLQQALIKPLLNSQVQRRKVEGTTPNPKPNVLPPYFSLAKTDGSAARQKPFPVAKSGSEMATVDPDERDRFDSDEANSTVLPHVKGSSTITTPAPPTPVVDKGSGESEPPVAGMAEKQQKPTLKQVLEKMSTMDIRQLIHPSNRSTADGDSYDTFCPMWRANRQIEMRPRSMMAFGRGLSLMADRNKLRRKQMEFFGHLSETDNGFYW